MSHPFQHRRGRQERRPVRPAQARCAPTKRLAAGDDQP